MKNYDSYSIQIEHKYDYTYEFMTFKTKQEVTNFLYSDSIYKVHSCYGHIGFEGKAEELDLDLFF